MTNQLTESYLEYIHIQVVSEYTVLQEIAKISDASIKKNSDAFTKNLKTIKKFIRSKGINPDVFINKFKGFKKEVEKAHKKGLPPEKLAKQLVKRVVDEAKDSINDMSMPDKVYMSLVLFLLVAVIQFIFLGVFSVLKLTPAISMQILAIVIAPLTEEALKAVAVKEKFPWVFTSVLTGIETVGYVANMVDQGANLTRAVIMRIVTALMHFFTTFIIKKFDEADKPITGYIIAVIIHAVFNFIALKYNKNIIGWVGIKS